MYFPKLLTPKNVIKNIYKKSHFRGPFNKQHVRLSKHLLNLNHTTLTIIIDNCKGSRIGKNLF